MLQPGCNQTQIHGHTAKLEGDTVELIIAFADIKSIEQLFVDFRKQQKNPDAEQKILVGFFLCFPQQKGDQKGQEKSYAPKEQMESPVGFRRRHLFRRKFEKAHQ
ncbi:MAG: hypothetical protein ACLR06_17675 [Christensenellaceae bacterium]